MTKQTKQQLELDELITKSITVIVANIIMNGERLKGKQRAIYSIEANRCNEALKKHIRSIGYWHNRLIAASASEEGVE